MAKRGDPNVLRLVVVFLRFHARLTQADFGKAAGVAQADVSRYESGNQPPPEEALRRMAAVAGVPWPLVNHLRRFYAALLSASAQRRVVETSAAPLDTSLLEPALLAVKPNLIEDATADPDRQDPEEARREAAEGWASLERFPLRRRRRLIELSLRVSRSWAMVEKVCHESERAAADKFAEALELADLALSIARRVPGKESWRSRLEGYCWAYVANARRVANDLAGADEAFARAWDLWQRGTQVGPDDLLSEWRLLDLEASLRRAERRFHEALGLLDRARVSSGSNPLATARILLKKEHTFDQMGDIQGGLAALAEAAPFVEASGDPHLLFALRFKTTNHLYHLERYTEAADLLPQVRELALRQDNELDLLRVVWLESRVAAGLGRKAEARAGLEQVRREFTARRLPYDAALVSLELAVLWLEDGRVAEVRELAVAMAWIFQAQGIARELLAALRLFRDAALGETATVELARQAMAELEKARRSAPLP